MSFDMRLSITSRRANRLPSCSREYSRSRSSLWLRHLHWCSLMHLSPSQQRLRLGLGRRIRLRRLDERAQRGGAGLDVVDDEASVGAVLALLHPPHVIEVDVERTQLLGVRQGKLDVVQRLGCVVAQVLVDFRSSRMRAVTSSSVFSRCSGQIYTGAFSSRKVARTSENSVGRLLSQLTWPFWWQHPHTPV